MMIKLKLPDGTVFEYDDTPAIEFRKQYKIDHECCPKCGSKDYGSTFAGYVMFDNDLESYRDENTCVCSHCGDKHIFHNRVKQK